MSRFTLSKRLHHLNLILGSTFGKIDSNRNITIGEEAGTCDLMSVDQNSTEVLVEVCMGTASSDATAQLQEKIVCELCGREFSQPRYYKVHSEKCSKKIECSICHKPFSTKGSLTRHVKKFHNVWLFTLYSFKLWALLFSERILIDFGKNWLNFNVIF